MKVSTFRSENEPEAKWSHETESSIETSLTECIWGWAMVGIFSKEAVNGRSIWQGENDKIDALLKESRWGIY